VPEIDEVDLDAADDPLLVALDELRRRKDLARERVVREVGPVFGALLVRDDVATWSR
jgi:hypothetical protein